MKPVYTPISLPLPLEREVNRILGKFGYYLVRMRKDAPPPKGAILLLGREALEMLTRMPPKRFYSLYGGCLPSFSWTVIEIFLLEKGKAGKETLMDALFLAANCGGIPWIVAKDIQRYARPFRAREMGRIGKFTLSVLAKNSFFQAVLEKEEPKGVELPSPLGLYEEIWGYLLPSRNLRPLAPLPESHLSLLLAAGFIPYAQVEVGGKEVEVTSITRRFTVEKPMPLERVLLKEGPAEVSVVKRREVWGLEVYLMDGEKRKQIFPQEEE